MALDFLRGAQRRHEEPFVAQLNQNLMLAVLHNDATYCRLAFASHCLMDDSIGFLGYWTVR